MDINEVNAENLREISEKVVVEDAEFFWKQYKEVLWTELMGSAKTGHRKYEVAYIHGRSSSNDWLLEDFLCNKIEDELVKLGFRVEFSINNQGQVYYSKRMTISW